MQAPVAVRCLWTNCYTLPLPLPLPNDNVSMSVGHLDHVSTVYSSMEHVTWKSPGPIWNETLSLGNILQLCGVRSVYKTDESYSFFLFSCTFCTFCVLSRVIILRIFSWLHAWVFLAPVQFIARNDLSLTWHNVEWDMKFCLLTHAPDEYLCSGYWYLTLSK